MAELGLSGESLASLNSLAAAIQANTDALGTKSEGDADNVQRQHSSRSGLVNALNKLSIPLPGGARLFGIGDFLTSISDADGVMNKFATGIGQMTIAIFGATVAFNALAKSLGGVTGREAMQVSLGAVGQTLRGIGQLMPGGAQGRIRNPLTGVGMTTAFGGEFGGLLTPEAAAKLGDVADDLGLSVGQLSTLERTMQATGISSLDAVNQFKQVGFLGGVATEEMNKNAGAIARAGGEFNKFIVSGIKNAKALGYEFAEIENKLTGFTLDFEGTVSSFSELRAVIPGMATDFGQLLSTAMTGTQEEYVDQIRSGLFGAGISSASQLNRQTAALLEQATGFSADQIDRILQGQEIDQDMKEVLDTERNSLLRTQITATTTGLGMIVGAIIGSSGLKGALATGLALTGGAIFGGIIGGAAGAAAGSFATSGMDDFVYRPGQPPVPFNSKDTLVGVKDPSMLGGNRNLEAKMDRIANLLSGQQTVNVNLENGTAWVARHVGNATQGELRTA